MVAKHEASLDQGTLFQMSEAAVTPQGLDPVARIDGILKDHTDADQEKRDALLDNPRIKTLIETGQLTTAGAFAIESASGTTEPPMISKPRRKSSNTRGGRAYSEGTENELDPYWNGPALELSPEEGLSGREKMSAVAANARRDKATKDFLAEVDAGHVGDAIARLRNLGYTPDPRTKGRTILTLAEATKLTEENAWSEA